MDIEIWGFDHDVVDVLALPGGVMVLVGTLFLRFGTRNSFIKIHLLSILSIHLQGQVTYWI